MSSSTGRSACDEPTPERPLTERLPERPPWPRYRCPSCTHEIGWEAVRARANTLVRCTTCGRRYPLVDGIPGLITAEDLARCRPFLRHYRRVRAAERWAVEPSVWRMLPYAPPATAHARLWRRRAHSFERLLRVLAVRAQGHPLDLLDLGAGSCWLAWQLARRGYRVEALDINVDAADGLRAIPSDAIGAFGRTQATLERLPYLEKQFDVVVAGASLHYARDLRVALAETARVLRPGGAVIVLDTPIYHTADAGRKRAAYRLAADCLHYGSDGTGTTGPGYTTGVALCQACRAAGLSYREIPLHGTLRALAGRLRRGIGHAVRRPERAHMPLVVAERVR